MSNLKLGVEVVTAHDLLPKEKQRLCSPFIELHCDHQKFRTTVKEHDLNPVWNECFYFNISDPNTLPSLTLEVQAYNHNKATNSKSFLGKVRIPGTSFVPYSDAVVLHYPLEKRTVFSRSRGEIGLKVFVTDDPSIRPSNPLPEDELPAKNSSHTPRWSFSSRDRSEKRHTFHHLPDSGHTPKLQVSHPPKPPPGIQQAFNHGMHPVVPRSVQMNPGLSSQALPDFSLRETSPFLGGGQVIGGRVIHRNGPIGTHDLVEQMRFLFVRVVKARHLPAKDATGSLDPFVEVKIGNFKGITKHYEKNHNPEWNEVFAFARENLQSSSLEVAVKDKNLVKDDYVGFVRFDLNEVPTRVPPDSPLAPEWYRIEDKKGNRSDNGEIMLAVWFGTQADEAFPEACYSDSFTATDRSYVTTQIRSKVYHSPRLWYIRVNVIEAQDLIVPEKGRVPEAYVKIQIGSQVYKTKPAQAPNLNPRWDEEFMFVAAEPFEEQLIISVEDRATGETMGKAVLPLTSVERRADDRYIRSRWLHLEKSFSDAMDEDRAKKDRFSSRLHLSVCLDGGYHVLDESTYYSSDLRPTAKQLWKPPIGVLELGILNADGLHPMKTRDGKGTSDTFCVAKYGNKWVRTRTVMNSLNPRYNEQYSWEVFDPATVLTVGVFDNGHLNGSNGGSKDVKIGKVRIRLSTLQTGRVYTHSYPLLVLLPSGVKRMGDLHLAIRFSCTSMTDMMVKYTKPLLPKMHYVRPLKVAQQELLRYQAVNVVAARLGRAEPPLRKEVVEYMTDAHSHLWSMRRSKANFFRLMAVFSGLLSFVKWFGEVCAWKNPVTTVLVHVLFTMLVCFPEMIFPTLFIYMAVIGIWNYRFRPRTPPHMDTKLSHAESLHQDELDAEFDTFPTTRPPDIVRMRYDRLRSVAGKIQSVVGDIAAQGERLQGLLSWRDPRATTIFVVFCLVIAVVMYVTPFQVLALFTGFYVMRHPRFRRKMPSAPINFFRRLPALSDSML